MNAQWAKVRQEWRANRRLRIGVLLALLVVGVHLLLVMGDHRRSTMAAYAKDLELQARMEGVGRDEAWPARADEATAKYEAMMSAIPVVTGSGLAKAELQNWLTQFAASAEVSEPRVKVEDSLEVPDHPGMWQVLARLDGKIGQYGHAGFARALSGALPWIQVERLEIAEGAPARVSVVVRGYYRQNPASGDVDATVQSRPPALGGGLR